MHGDCGKKRQSKLSGGGGGGVGARLDSVWASAGLSTFLGRQVHTVCVKLRTRQWGMEGGGTGEEGWAHPQRDNPPCNQEQVNPWEVKCGYHVRVAWADLEGC